MRTSGPQGTVLATGTYDPGSHPRVQVLIDGLRARGWAVDEVTEPLALSTAERVAVLQRPRLLPLLVRALVRSWRRLLPRLRARRGLPRPDAVLVGHLGHFDVRMVRRLTRPSPVVLDFLISGAGTATDRGERGSVKQRLLRGLDEWALRGADVVLVDTEEHRAALPARHRDRAVVVPVGAEARWFDAGRDRPSAPGDGERLSVVFYGLMTPLQGAPVIAAAIRLLDGAVDVTIVGTGQDEARVDELLRGVPAVTRLPWVASRDLPALVAAHDVCLGVVGTTDKAQRVVPNKVFQGAAAGCVVVTSDTPPQRRALGDDALLVPPGDPRRLADALASLAEDRDLVRRLAAASTARARERFTADAVVGELEPALRRVTRT